MNTESSAIPRVGATSLTSFRAALEWRVLPILLLLGLCLIVGPSTALAKAYRASEWQRSLILPPPYEPPPPPPPGEDLLTNYDNSAAPAAANLCNSIAAADCGNILELPRVVFFRRVTSARRYREAEPSGHLNHQMLRREYSEEHLDGDRPPRDEPPTDYERDLKIPPPDRAPLEPPTGGFIPLNPRGITVRPDERSPLPPTSPLLTTPPGSAAMPYVWRP